MTTYPVPVQVDVGRPLEVESSASGASFPQTTVPLHSETTDYSMYRFWTALLAAVLLLAGCSDTPSSFTVEKRDGVTYAVNREGWAVWSDSAAAPLQLEHEQTYGVSERSGPALLGEIQGVAVDSAGTVYVLDGENHRLVAFNPDGTVDWSAGRWGEGPGEFSRPDGIVVGENGRLFVANDSGRQIDVWTTEGTFVERHAFPKKDLGFLDPIGYTTGFLVVSESGMGSEPQRIHTVNPDTWEVVHSFPLSVELKLPENLSVSKSARTVGDRIFVSALGRYAVYEYSLDGTLERRISRRIDVILKPGVFDGGVRIYSHLYAPVRLPTGHFLTWASWPTNVDDPDTHYRRSRNDAADEAIYASSLDLFKPDGRYVGSFRWDDRRSPPIGDPKAVGPNGVLYTTATSPFPQVRRFDVTVRTD